MTKAASRPLDVLVIDDSAVVRQSMAAVLARRAGTSVSAASDAGAVWRVTCFRGRHQCKSFAQGIGGFAIAVIFVVGLGEYFVKLEGIGLASPAGLIEQG